MIHESDTLPSDASAGEPHHPGDDALLAYADGMLSKDSAGSIARHVAGCMTCASRERDILEARLLFKDAVRMLDATEPLRWHMPSPALLNMPPQNHVQRARSSRRRLAVQAISMLPWAAAAVVVIGTAAYAAAHVLGKRLTREIPESVRAPAHTTTALGPQSAILLPITHQSIHIRLDSAGRGSRVIIAHDDATPDSGWVHVQLSGVPDPRYQSRGNTLAVSLHDRSAVVRILVPPGVLEARITANGRELARVVNGQVIPAAAAASGIVVR